MTGKRVLLIALAGILGVLLVAPMAGATSGDRSLAAPTWAPADTGANPMMLASSLTEQNAAAAVHDSLQGRKAASGKNHRNWFKKKTRKLKKRHKKHR